MQLTVIHLHLKATSRTVFSLNEEAIFIYRSILGSSANLKLNRVSEQHPSKQENNESFDAQSKLSNTIKFATFSRKEMPQ